MIKPAVVRDRLYSRFTTAIGHAYNLSDSLSAFWLYATQLAHFEAQALGGEDPDQTMALVRISLYSIDDQSFARRGLLGPEVGRLLEIAHDCERIGLAKTAETLRLFSAVTKEIAATSREDCWCQHDIEKLTCETCGHEARYQLWQVVNTKRRPSLKSDAQAGRLRNEARCYICESLIQKSHFFYCDPEREEFLVVWPYDASVDPDQTIRMYHDCLEQMPLDMRDGKEQIVYVSGMPAVVFQESDVAGMTLCRSIDEFVEVVNDDLMFNVEPTANIDAMSDYFAAGNLVSDKNWLPAAAAFARSFLKDPIRVSFLGNIASCLRNLNREEEAESIMHEGNRLYTFLIEHRIIKRIVRMSIGTDSSGDELHASILTEGIPADWGFDDLILQLQMIIEQDSADPQR